MLKYSQTPGIFKLEGNRLGRPYHRLPTMFTGSFDTIESHLGNYFLKKHRTNITLKKIQCEMDVINKSAELLVSQVGHLAFDEIRLRSRLALDICNIIFNKNISGIPLTLKPDSSTIQTHWAYQLTFVLGDDENCSFRILLDDSHTDYILNLIRRSEHGEKKKQIDKASAETRKKTLIKEIIHTLPLTMNVKIAEIPLNVADLTTIKPGDILPIAMPDTFPVYIGKSELFNALIVEDKDKLFLSELTSKTEKSYE
ncbi:MAG: FliM/FliN family flagellar motor switch protein [Citrobacter freundii]|nr:FliM/FliN family flagellar motor switch protein [Citrobacter freundii]